MSERTNKPIILSTNIEDFTSIFEKLKSIPDKTFDQIKKVSRNNFSGGLNIEMEREKHCGKSNDIIYLPKDIYRIMNDEKMITAYNKNDTFTIPLDINSLKDIEIQFV